MTPPPDNRGDRPGRGVEGVKTSTNTHTHTAVLYVCHNVMEIILHLFCCSGSGLPIFPAIDVRDETSHNITLMCEGHQACSVFLCVSVITALLLDITHIH